MRQYTKSLGELGADQVEVLIVATPVEPGERVGGMRLNSAMKGQVIEKALKHAFTPRSETLVKEEQALSRLFWLDKFGTAKLKMARALGAPFAQECFDRYSGKTAPEGIPVQFNVGGQTVCLKCQLPLNANGALGSKQVVIKDAALIARCRAWQDATTTLTNEYNEVQATLSGMLSNINSYTSLEKNWPQGKPFYKHLPKAFPYRHQVPAVLIDKLNTALGV